jgi:hypothetical protein
LVPPEVKCVYQAKTFWYLLPPSRLRFFILPLGLIARRALAPLRKAMQPWSSRAVKQVSMSNFVFERQNIFPLPVSRLFGEG